MAYKTSWNPQNILSVIPSQELFVLHEILFNTLLTLPDEYYWNVLTISCLYECAYCLHYVVENRIEHAHKVLSVVDRTILGLVH